MNELELREQIAMHGKSLYERGYTCGSSGNISVKLTDGILVTPTNCCLGRLEPDQISKVSWEGNHQSGGKPSKETFLHLAMYNSRPDEAAIVHLHSTYSVAVSCLKNIDPKNVLPAITAYYVMRVGQLPLVPYYAPGDMNLARHVEKLASQSRAMLLANHGPVIASQTLDQAVYAMEELEETAKLFLLLQNHEFNPLTESQIADLKE
ncbi:MAG: aldolase, partial [Alphaproteobacteria bacterium]